NTPVEVARPDGVRLARVPARGCAELLHGVLADGLEEAVAGAVTALLADDERFVDQLSQQVEDLERLAGRRPADRLGGLQRPAAGEDRQAAEQRPLPFGEQVVTPIDERVQRLLARERGAAAA